MAATANRAVEIGGEVPQHAAAPSTPYRVLVEVQGVSDLLLKRWNCEQVEAQQKAAKGSAEKKTDNLEASVYRDDKGFICIPGEYFRMSIINAAKFKQDPRSPRKSAMDLFKAAIVALTPLASLGSKKWEYEDKRRVVVQRAGITRTRPAFKEGWRVKFILMCNLPEYVSPTLLNEVLASAGRLVGVGDFRPTYGRFQIVSFTQLDD